MDLLKFIDLQLNARGIKKYNLESVEIIVDKAKKIIDLNKYLYILVSKSVDLMSYACVNLISTDNFFRFSRDSYNTCQLQQHQIFSKSLEVITENNVSDTDSNVFIPFTLEFVKVIPLEDRA